MQRHRIYKLNLNKFGEFVTVLGAFAMLVYLWVAVLLGLAGM